MNISSGLYQAHHDLEPVADPQGRRVVGRGRPVCESADVSEARRFRRSPARPDRLRTAGAYGMGWLAYNAARARRILVTGDPAIIRAREVIID